MYAIFQVPPPPAFFKNFPIGDAVNRNPVEIVDQFGTPEKWAKMEALKVACKIMLTLKAL